MADVWMNRTILARSPRLSTGIRVASGFEFSVCLFVCSLSVLIKFSNLFKLTKHHWGSLKRCENEYQRIGIEFGGVGGLWGLRRVLTAWLGTIFTRYIYPIWNNYKIWALRAYPSSSCRGLGGPLGPSGSLWSPFSSRRCKTKHT